DCVAGLGDSAILFINNQTVREVYNKSNATSSHGGGVACFTQISKLHEKRLLTLCKSNLCEDVASNIVAATLALAEQHHSLKSMKIARLKQISLKAELFAFSSNHTAILFFVPRHVSTYGRSDYRNGGRHDALLSGVPRPYSGGSRQGRGRGSYNKGYDGRSRKSKDGEGGYGSFPDTTSPSTAFHLETPTCVITNSMSLGSTPVSSTSSTSWAVVAISSDLKREKMEEREKSVELWIAGSEKRKGKLNK
ncbi:hypothetical protein Tco_0896543, partial [Tanacetum coccineum]